MIFCRSNLRSFSVRCYALIIIYFWPMNLTTVLSTSKDFMNNDLKSATASPGSLLSATSLYGSDQFTLMGPTLPVCTANAICSRANNFAGQKQVHRICNCLANHAAGTGDSRKNGAEEPEEGECRYSTNTSDGFTFENDGQYYTMCKPVRTIPECRFFRDTTFVITSYPSRSQFQQTARCICPNGSSTYMTKWMQKHKGPYGKIVYHYACAPPPLMECNADEPCAVFISSVRKSIHKQNACRCPSGSSCPETLIQKGVSLFEKDNKSNATSYGAYCMSINRH